MMQRLEPVTCYLLPDESLKTSCVKSKIIKYRAVCKVLELEQNLHDLFFVYYQYEDTNIPGTKVRREMSTQLFGSPSSSAL